MKAVAPAKWCAGVYQLVFWCGTAKQGYGANLRAEQKWKDWREEEQGEVLIQTAVADARKLRAKEEKREYHRSCGGRRAEEEIVAKEERGENNTAVAEEQEPGEEVVAKEEKRGENNTAVAEEEKQGEEEEYHRSCGGDHGEGGAMAKEE